MMSCSFSSSLKRISKRPSLVKREAYLASQDNHCLRTTTYRCETLLVKRISFRRFDASRVTLHERRGYSQAGC